MTLLTVLAAFVAVLVILGCALTMFVIALFVVEQIRALPERELAEPARSAGLRLVPRDELADRRERRGERIA